jgi:hypothetical protein
MVDSSCFWSWSKLAISDVRSHRDAESPRLISTPTFMSKKVLMLVLGTKYTGKMGAVADERLRPSSSDRKS